MYRTKVRTQFAQVRKVVHIINNDCKIHMETADILGYQKRRAMADAPRGRPEAGDSRSENGYTSEAWLALVEAEVCAIERLEVVKGGVGFLFGELMNDNKVYASVWCCWEPSRRTFKQLKVACNGSDRPTHLEALRVLHATIKGKHGQETHVHHPQAVAQRQVLMLNPGEEVTRQFEFARASSAAGTSRCRTVLDREALLSARTAMEVLMAGQRLQQKLETAERNLKAARLQEAAANERLHVAKEEQRAAREARSGVAAETVVLREMRKALSGAKRPCPNHHQAPEDDEPLEQASEGAVEAEGACNEKLDDDELDSCDAHYHNWEQTARWKAKETWLQRRRAIPIDPTCNEDETLPRDAKDGWRTHWRRGLYGSIQDWAAGRRFRVVHMLVELAKHYGIEKEVCSPMRVTVWSA